MSSIAAHPSDPDIIYVGAGVGGVWKTTDAGSTWLPLFDDQPTFSIGAVTLDPKAPETVYVGTGEGHHGGYTGEGIFKSTDGGAQWKKIGGETFVNCNTTDLLVSPSNSSLVVVSVTEVGAISRKRNFCKSGIYRSEDAGANWSRIDVGGTASPTDLAVDFVNPNLWFAAFENTGIFRSVDSGVTWTQSSEGLPTSNFGRTKLTVSPVDPDRLYAAVTNGFQPQDAQDGSLLGVWRSSDGGDSWQQATSPSTSGFFCRHQCGYDLIITADPSSAQTFYVGGIFTYVSRDGGSTYTDLTVLLDGVSLHADAHAFAFDAEGNLLAGNDGGIVRLENNETKYVSLNTNLSTIQIAPGIAGSVAGPLLAGTHDLSSVLYTGSTSWKYVGGSTRSGDTANAAMDPTDPKVMYVSDSTHAVARSVDGGRNWTKISTSLMESESGAGYSTPFLMSPHDPDRLYQGKRRLWVTSNRGNTWSAASPDLGSSITSLAIAPGDPQTIYMGARGGKFYATSDGGTTWTTQSTFDLGDFMAIESIAVSKNDVREVYAVTNQFSTNKVLHSNDGGKTWADVSGNLPEVRAYAIVLDESVTPPNVFLGTHYGVSYSKGDSGKWGPYGKGLPTSLSSSLMIDPSGKLVVGTFGRGVFWAPIPGDLAPPASTSQSFARSVTLKLSGHLTATGQVIAADAPSGCLVDVQVFIHRKKKNGRVLVGNGTTNSTGKYGVSLPDKAGRYQSSIKRLALGDTVCNSAQSPLKTHKH